MNHIASTHRTAWIFLSALFLLTILYRVVAVEFLPGLPNFSPVMAIAFCGALFLPGGIALGFVLGALVLSDLLLNLHYGAALFSSGELVRYVCYAAAVGAGMLLRNRRNNLGVVFGAVAGNALLFYLLTNTAAWAGNPAYMQSPAGWVQALTVGLPGFPPTWMFFRNSLISDVLFAALAIGVFHLAAKQQGAREKYGRGAV